MKYKLTDILLSRPLSCIMSRTAVPGVCGADNNSRYNVHKRRFGVCGPEESPFGTKFFKRKGRIITEFFSTGSFQPDFISNNKESVYVIINAKEEL